MPYGLYIVGNLNRSKIIYTIVKIHNGIHLRCWNQALTKTSYATEVSPQSILNGWYENGCKSTATNFNNNDNNMVKK